MFALLQQAAQTAEHLSWPDAFAIVGGAFAAACFIGFLNGWRPFQKK